MTRVAAERGIQPSMLRQWRAARNGDPPRLRAGRTAVLLRRSDRGSEDATEADVAQLAAVGAAPSMSRKGCRCDNARMESFVHTLKVELVHQGRWATHGAARRDLFSPIETDHDRARMHPALGDLTPEQAEQRMAS